MQLIYCDRKQVIDCLEMKGWKKGIIKRHEHFGVIELSITLSYYFVGVYNTKLIAVYFKYMQFILCWLYLNKAVVYFFLSEGKMKTFWTIKSTICHDQINTVKICQRKVLQPEGKLYQKPRSIKGMKNTKKIITVWVSKNIFLMFKFFWKII